MHRIITIKKTCGHDVPVLRKLIKRFNIILRVFAKYDRHKILYISLTFNSKDYFPSLT